MVTPKFINCDMNVQEQQQFINLERSEPKKPLVMNATRARGTLQTSSSLSPVLITYNEETLHRGGTGTYQ